MCTATATLLPNAAMAVGNLLTATATTRKGGSMAVMPAAAVSSAPDCPWLCLSPVERLMVLREHHHPAGLDHFPAGRCSPCHPAIFRPGAGVPPAPAPGPLSGHVGAMRGNPDETILPGLPPQPAWGHRSGLRARDLASHRRQCIQQSSPAGAAHTSARPAFSPRAACHPQPEGTYPLELRRCKGETPRSSSASGR